MKEINGDIYPKGSILGPILYYGTAIFAGVLIAGGILLIWWSLS